MRLLDALGMGGCDGGAGAGGAGGAEDIVVVELVVLSFELCKALSCVMRFVGWMGKFSRTALTSVGALAPGCLADAT